MTSAAHSPDAAPPPTVPHVGMGATYSVGSDQRPCTVVAVVDKRTIVVIRDRKRQTEGAPIFLTEPDGVRETYTLRKNKTWVRRGQTMRGNGFISLGKRTSHTDPEF